MRVHDLLVLNEINSAVMTRNKLLLNSFDKKALLTDVKNQTWVDQQRLNKLMQQDIEKLGGKFPLDAEKKGKVLDNAEKLNISFDSEELMGYQLI